MTSTLPACIALVLATLAAVLAGRWWLRGRDVMEAARGIAADAVERRYNLLEAVREGIYIVDDDLRITHVNDEAERLLHRTADDMIGVELPDIVDPLASELVPDIRAARRSGVAIARVHAFPALQTWVEVRILPAADETLISMQDVSAQTIAESQLHENAHSLQLVANNVDAILWTVGRDGRFTAVSGGALSELDLNASDLLGQPSSALVAESVVRDVFTGRHVRVESAHGDHWLRHHVEPLADRDRNIIGAVGVSIDITELKRTQRQLFDAAHRDRLTELPNRFSLDQRLQEAVALAARENGRLALLFLDLDRFKAINDTMGHGAGDEVLREVGARLHRCVRGGDFIARPGGDEFVILMSSITGEKDIEMLSQRLIRAVSAPIQLDDREVYVGVSIGAALFPEHGTRRERAHGARGRRDVPRESRRRKLAHRVRRRDARRRRGALRARSRSSQRADARRARSRVPAAGRPQLEHDLGLRSPRALAPPDARHRAAVRVHPHRGTVRNDRRHRPLGAPPGVLRARDVPHDRSRTSGSR